MSWSDSEGSVEVDVSGVDFTCKDAVLKLMEQDGEKLYKASAELRSDSEVVLAAQKTWENAFEFALGAARKDRELMLACVALYSGALEDFDEEFRNDREIVLAAVTNPEFSAQMMEGSPLKFASAALRADKNIVMAAIEKDGAAFAWADKSLRDDREVVLAALKQSGRALGWVSKRLCYDREVLRAALTGRALTSWRILTVLKKTFAWPRDARIYIPTLQCHLSELANGGELPEVCEQVLGEDENDFNECMRRIVSFCLEDKDWLLAGAAALNELITRTNGKCKSDSYSLDDAAVDNNLSDDQRECAGMLLVLEDVIVHAVNCALTDDIQVATLEKLVELAHACKLNDVLMASPINARGTHPLQKSLDLALADASQVENQEDTPGAGQESSSVPVIAAFTGASYSCSTNRLNFVNKYFPGATMSAVRKQAIAKVLQKAAESAQAEQAGSGGVGSA